MKLKKPTKKSREAYDYMECSAYVEKKYKYDERDYVGKYKDKGRDSSKPTRKPSLDPPRAGQAWF